MKEIKTNDFKKIQVEILKYVDNFCKKNNIKYWLEFGTLLGAVRHKGYIPWDDDIDIGMLREDYNKFIKTFNKNNDKYKVNCIELDENFYTPYGKVFDTTTIIYEPNKKTGIKSSISIDLFILDNIPNNKAIVKKIFFKRNIYRKLHLFQTYKTSYYKKNKKYAFIRYPIHLLLQIFPKRYFCKKIVKLSQKFKNIDTTKVATIVDNSKFIFEKNLYNNLIDIEFEKQKYKAPKDYNTILTTYYGNYMKLPPTDQQKSHHRFDAFYK